MKALLYSLLLISLPLFCCADDENQTYQLEKSIKENQERSQKADSKQKGNNERALLSSYDTFPIQQMPLLVTTAVLEDGFGDYIHLKYVLGQLIKLGLKDIKVVVYCADCHKNKLALHPIPKAEGVDVHLIMFDRYMSTCTFDEDGHLSSCLKETLGDFISQGKHFEEYREGKRELVVVAAFFAKAFGNLKSIPKRHPLFLRELNPYHTNTLLQDLYIMGWGRNQAMPVDEEVLKIKKMGEQEKIHTAFQILPKRLLTRICGGKANEAVFANHLSEHVLHHSYFHQPASEVAFFLVSMLSSPTDSSQHDFLTKNCRGLYKYFSDLLKDKVKQQGVLSLLFKEIKIGEIEFCFLDGKKVSLEFLNRDKKAKNIRFIETEFLPSESYHLLTSLIGKPYLQGCTGDHSAQQALLQGHLPLIEHTASKDYPLKHGVETHFCQNSASLFQALCQLKPYPEKLSAVALIADQLMFNVRKMNVAAFQDEESLLLIKQLGDRIKQGDYQTELETFSNFIVKERNLAETLRWLIKRQALLRNYPETLPTLEKIALGALDGADAEMQKIVLNNFKNKLLHLYSTQGDQHAPLRELP